MPRQKPQQLANERWTFSKSRANRAIALDISRAFDKVWYVGLFHKCKSHGISSQILGLMSSFLSSRQLYVVLDAVFTEISS